MAKMSKAQMVGIVLIGEQVYRAKGLVKKYIETSTGMTRINKDGSKESYTWKQLDEIKQAWRESDMWHPVEYLF